MPAAPAAVLAYFAVLTLWIYGVLDRGEWAGWLLPLLALVQITLGFVVGRWRTVLLPLLLILVAVPAMDPPITPDSAGPFPIFVSVGLWALFAAPLVALGVGTRKIL